MATTAERLARHSVQCKRIAESAFAVVAPESRLRVRHEREVGMSDKEQLLRGETAGGDGVVAYAWSVWRQGTRIAVEIDGGQSLELIDGYFVVSAAALDDCTDRMLEIDKSRQHAWRRDAVDGLNVPSCRSGMTPYARNLVRGACLRRRLEIKYRVHWLYEREL